MCDDFACFGFDEIRLLSYVLWHFVKWIVLNLDEFEVSVDKHQELDWVIRDYYPLLRSPVDGNKDWIRMCSCNYHGSFKRRKELFERDTPSFAFADL